MLNFRRVILIIIILILLAIFVQYFRTEFIDSSSHTEAIQAADIVIKEQEVSGKESYLLITDQKNETLKAVETQFSQVLFDMKMAVDYVDVNDFKQPSSRYDYHVFILSDLNKIDNVEGVFDFIADGGKVIFPYRLEFNDTFSGVYRLLGITEHGEFETVRGVKLSKGFMVNSEIVTSEMTEHLENTSISVQLNEKSEVLLSASNDLSLAWTYPYGQGLISYFNGSILDQKENRGIIIGLINAIRPLKIYPILNTQVHIIENMPSPIPSGNSEVIFDDYQRSTLRFYKEIWWPDMTEMRSRFNHVFSGSLLGTYDDYTSNSLSDYYFIKRENLSVFGRELLNSQGEIMMGGFNKQPLVIGGDWETPKEMLDSINTMENFFNIVFVEYTIRAFASSDNQMDVTLLKNLIKKGYLVFTSKYTGNPGLFKQEFGVRDGYVEHPIVSSGYLMTNQKLWDVYNVIVGNGNVTHQIAFDDIFDSKRSEGQNWKGMYENLYEYYEWLDDEFKWLRNMTISNSAKSIIDYYNVNPEYVYEDDIVVIHTRNRVNEVYYLLNDSRNITRVNGGEVTRIDDVTYLIKVYEDKTTLQFER